MRKVTAVLLTGLISINAQQSITPGSDLTFKATSKLVIEVVSARDKNGKTIDDLKLEDFIVTENGTVQKLQFCEFQRLPGPIEATAGLPVRADASPVSAAAEDAEPANEVMPEKPGELRYRDKRLIALYFDMSAMPVPDQLRTFTAARKFVQTQASPADSIALIQFSGGSVRVLQGFTGNRLRLMSVLNRLVTADEGLDQTAVGDGAVNTGAAFGQDDGEFNVFNSDRQLAALQTAVKMLGTLSERKSMIYFASGLRLNGIDNQAQLRSTLNSAIRANVVLYPVDARGLVAEAPLGDATKGSPAGTGMYSGASATAIQDVFQKSQDALYNLAADTGGKAMLDYNDLSMGIVEAQKAAASYYLLGYYTTNAEPDGKFRRITISLKEYPNARLDYRRGYYGDKTFARFTEADKERQLEDALMLGDPITDLSIAMEVNYFQLNNAEYYVPVMMKIPGSELVLARNGGAERTSIDFIGEIRDAYGTTVQNIRDRVSIKLAGQTAAELRVRPILYDTGYTLLPGRYSIKVLARDATTGRIGTYMRSFVIPNLNKETDQIPISSAVLSSQSIGMENVLYTAGTGKDQLVNPLVTDGQKIIPNISRIFSNKRDMHIYVEAYEKWTQATEPLVAFVSFYRGEKKMLETLPVPASVSVNNQLKTVPLKFNIALTALTAGRYQCQVTVLAPKSSRVAFWRTSMMVVE